MGFSIGDDFPHIMRNGRVAWVRITSAKQAKFAEKYVKDNQDALAKKGLTITAGMRSVTRVKDIVERPYWKLALNKTFSRPGTIDKIIKDAFKTSFK